MGVLDWLRKKLKGNSSSKKLKEANRVSNYGGGVSTKSTKATVSNSVSAAKTAKKNEEKKAQEKKNAQISSAFKAATSTTKKIAETRGSSTEKTSEKYDAFNKKNAFKATPPPTIKHQSTALGTLSISDTKSRIAKKNAADANRKEQLRTAERLKKNSGIAEKYSGKTAESRRRIKSGEYMSDPDVAKYEYLKHPVASSLARGGLSGTTFGLSELAAQKLPKSKGMEEAERLYQANKSKGAEFIGEMAGSIASFGATGDLSKMALSKAAPKLTAKVGASATERLAANKLVVNAAKREAIRKIGITATEKEIAQFARARAAKIVAAIGEDTAINLTTGAVSDVAHALIDSDNPAEFAKNIALSAGLNTILGGATTVAPALYRGSALDDSVRAIGGDVSDFGRDVARNMDNKSGGIKLTGDKPKSKPEIIASGRNWVEGRDLQLWKDGNTLYVGDPNDYSTWKSFGRDIPENRAAAQSEFDFVNNVRRPEERKGAKSSAESKPKTESKSKKANAKRPDGVRDFSEKELLQLKKDGKAYTLTKEEYDYYIYKRADDDPFIEKWESAGTNEKQKAKKGRKKATDSESVAKTAETPKAKETAPAEATENNTKKLTKEQLERKLKKSEKKLSALEQDIKKSSYASQYEQDNLSTQYTKALERKKKLEAQIKEAEESADGSITVNKRKKKPAKEVDESNVTVTKGKEEIVESAEKPKKGAKKNKTKKTSGEKAKTEKATTIKTAEKEVEAVKATGTDARKQAKSIKSLENKIKNADENIKKYEETLKEKHKSAASEKSIKYTQDQRAKEMKKRKDMKRELEELKASAETSENIVEQAPKAVETKPSKAKDKKSKVETKKETSTLKPDAVEAEKTAKKASAKDKALKQDAVATPPEKPMSKAAEKRAKREEAKQRLDALLDKAEKHQEAYDNGDTNALKDLVATEQEAKQAFRDAGMSRDEAYRESKKLFDKHKKELERLEKKGTAKATAEGSDVVPSTAEPETPKKNDNLKYYKEKQAERLKEIKAKDAETAEIDGKQYAVVDDSPFDEAGTRTTRTKPKFTSNEKKAAKAKTEKKKAVKEAAEKLETKSNKFKRNPSPRGESLHKKTYGSVTGETLDEAISPPTFNDYLDAKKTYTKGQASREKEVISRAGTSLMNATTDDAQREFLRDGWRDGDFNYVRIKNREKYAEVMKHWVDEPDAVARDIIRYNDDISTLGADKIVDMHYQAHCVMKMTRSQLDNPALSEAERESIRDIYSAAASLSQRLSSMSGQVNQFQGVMVGCSPARRSDNALENIVDMLDRAKGFRKNTKVEIDGKMVPLSGNASERRNQIRALLLDNEEISKTLNKVYDASTEEEYGEAMEELMRKSYTLNSATGFDYLQQWRYLAMLGNPKTHLRNIIGNVTFGNIRKISNAIRGGLESGLEGWATKKGLEIEMHGGLSPKAFAQAQSEKLVFDDAGRSAWESFKKHSKEILGDQKYNTPEMKGFLSELNSRALTAEDDFFRGRAYREQYIKGYNKYAKRGEITDEIKKKLHNEALRESQIATFNEFNELAQLLAKSQNGLYNANATVGKKVSSMASNALLPFTKVPANILKQSVNYSPAGLVKGYAHIIDAAKKGDSDLLNKAIDEMSSGLTGTGIAALGFVLGKNTDMFTTNAGSEDAAAKFKKQQGVQNYSVMFKGADGKQYSMTLDWLVPASSTFFMGVETANQFKNGLKGVDVGESLGNLSQITSRIIDPVLETSMLSGIYNIVEDSRKSASYDDQKSFADIVIRELVQSYLSSYVPTVSGQIARTAYGADKMVVGDSDTEYWINSMKVKLGLANTDILGERLGDDVNAYGEVKNKKDGSAKSYLKSFVKNAILPANIQEVSLTDTDKKKIKEYEDYVAAGGDPADKEYLFPKKSYKKNFTVGKKGADPLDIKLSNQQVSLYNQAKTTGGEEGMRVVLEGIMFNRYDKDSKGKRTILRNGYTSEQKEQLIQKFKGKSLREVEEWLYKQPQFKTASEEEKRKTINALWNYSQQGKAQGAKRVGEQAVFVNQGGNVNEYNFKNELSKNQQNALTPAIKDKIVSYDEVVDFARNAGVTYYYENDEGGTSKTYYNKKQMLEYLEKKGYSPEKAEVLFNAFKAANAKPYGYSSGRRGWRSGWHRWGYGGGGSGGSVKSTVKTGAFKPSVVHPSEGGSSGTKTPKTTVNVSSTKGAGSSAARSARSAGASRGGTRASVPTTNSRRTTARVSSNVKRSQSRVGSGSKIAITPLNIKTVKANTSKTAKNSSLAAALRDIENTQKKVAPPKARRK